MRSNSHMRPLNDEQLAQVTGGDAYNMGNTATVYQLVYAPQYIFIINSNISSSTIGGDTIYEVSSISQLNQLLNMGHHAHQHHDYDYDRDHDRQHHRR